MRVTQNKLILTAALSVALVGCGGGGDSDSDGGSGGGPAIPLADGTMESVNVTGKDFQAAMVPNTFSSGNCAASTAYFETENVMAYSAASHTEGELQRVASKVEYVMKGLVSKFGMSSMAEFMDRKRVLSYRFLDGRALQLTDLQKPNGDPIHPSELSTYLANNPPSGFSGWDDPVIEGVVEGRLIRSALVKVPSGGEAALIFNEMIGMAKTLTGQEFPSLTEDFEDAFMHDKIQICVLPDSMKGGAEGHAIGFNISAIEEYSFYVHEGTHFVQKQFVESFPRWLSEGQAVVFAGQGTASSRDGSNVTEVLSYSDEDGRSLYDQYGLAYKGLANNQSISDIITFLQAYDLGATWDIDTNGLMIRPELKMTQNEWADTFPGWVSYEEFGNTYDALAK